MTDLPPRVACPLCAERTRTRLFEKHGCPVARCPSCHLVYVDAEFGREDVEGLYGEDYYTGDAFHDYLGERAERVAGGRLHAGVLAGVQPGGRLLDVGCAAGFFLEAASAWYDVTGIEVSAFAADYARRELGHRVHTGDIVDVDLGGELFDVVTLWNTIEHVFDPVRVLGEVARHTRPGGLLVLSTGDVSGPLARRDLPGWNLMTPPEHLFFFSPRTIARLLQGAGFEARRFTFDGIVAERGPASRPLARSVAVVAGLGNVMTVYARRIPVRRASAIRRLASRYRPLRFV
jgi:2-polyprenyl-3-methyl-5-hydroxy-6-metoxy-1,4-benzoquinol methylase